MAVSNAWPERGASKVKLNKTRLRSRMKNDMLNAILCIQINGPALFTPECDALIHRAVKKWNEVKERRKKAALSGRLASSSTPCVSFSDGSTQTEPEEPEPSEEEIQGVLKLFVPETAYTEDLDDDNDDFYESDFDSDCEP